MSDAWIEPALAVFRAACELPPDQRARFLDDACGENAAFRRHVEAMLAWDERAAQLDGPAPIHSVRAALSNLARKAESVAADDAPIPDTIGGHRIVRLVARGGMGIVYEARQEHPDRRVAIKIAQSGATGERARRFELETQLLARLDHPGIAKVFAAGTTGPEDGERPFIVMEFVEGQRLTDYAREHLDSARGKLELVVAVCEAVGFAHRQGVVHRDLKPDNVLIDPAGKPKVLDFGVAKVAAAGGFGAATLRTEAGCILGTLGYMAPEQLAGETEGLGPAADVYSLGVLIYELLSGRLPHELDGVTLTRALAVVTKTDAPLLGVVRPEYRGEIEAIVAKALDKDHRYRYADATELQQDLERFLRGEPILARPAGPLRRLTKWAQRSPALASAVSALFLVLAASAGILFVKNREVQAALTENQRLLDRALVKQALADADTLWPTRSEQAPGLRKWIDTYRGLLERIPMHAAALEHLQAGTPEHDQLAGLVQGMENLARNPILERVADRLWLAANIEQNTVHDRLADWQAAALRIQESDQYHGLVLKPQVGLVPLGPDPDSKLEEFLHLETNAGNIPHRDADGRLPPITGDTGLVFVLIPGGSGPFRMGAQSENPTKDNFDAMAIEPREELHDEPAVEPFFLSKYEMTQGQWQRFAGTNQSDASSATKPVTRVSWFECDEIMRKLALILPHEVQWEYAARAGARDGTRTAWWTGPDERTLEGAENIFEKAAEEAGNPNWSEAWDVKAAPFRDAKKAAFYREQLAQQIPRGDLGPTPVGMYRANGFGLFDIGGNVGEWCANRIGYRNDRPPGPHPKFIVRGGSFKRGVKEARSASRRDGDPSLKLDEVGLRPAMTFQVP
ncbi:MAG TPA: bifunctional serine/threonine-protein kinase/formylglycine-generating enzyme family protein [Planctomycetota bacterium]|nr:bifunctional serine/threonine-protein kinase/formylglycine-generating enzyme family protein [Planctomycetota bacterium]